MSRRRMEEEKVVVVGGGWWWLVVVGGGEGERKVDKEMRMKTDENKSLEIQNINVVCSQFTNIKFTIKRIMSLPGCSICYVCWHLALMMRYLRHR